MPLGDPQGGLFEYTDEGLLDSLFAAFINVSDLDASVSFYRDMLGLELLGADDDSAYLVRGECKVVLRKGGPIAVDTGLCFGVDSPYNTHRRLVDEGVRFLVDPVRTPFGTCTSFLDPDGNIIRVMEKRADFRLRTIS